jgi:hypothetical protein
MEVGLASSLVVLSPLLSHGRVNSRWRKLGRNAEKVECRLKQSRLIRRFKYNS